MRVGIVGTGVSGLYLAMRLAEAGHQVELFGPPTGYGGNMDTARFEIGGVERFADLGVNDFNASTYKRLLAWLDKLGVEYLPLEDTTSFFSFDGATTYTTDGANGTAMPPDIAADFRRFQDEAPKDATRPEFAHVTVGEYVARKAYGEAFIRTNLLPRINAMYYCHDLGAETMPFRAVMIYYALQEGFGGQIPRRMYFKNGSASWTRALTEAGRKAGVKLHLGPMPEIYANGESVRLKLPAGETVFDAVVCALHATDVIAAVREGLTATDVAVLAGVRYFNSRVYVHQDASLLPVNVNAWRSFNVAIRGGGNGLLPFSMSYVENRHQNDASTPRFDHYLTPTFFTTLNPIKPVQPHLILNDLRGRPVSASFPHNTLDLASFERQRYVHDRLQGRAGLFFVGGWTKGAGLQEECLLSAEFVFDKLHTPSAQDPHLWHHGRDEAGVPDYYRQAVDA